MVRCSGFVFSLMWSFTSLQKFTKYHKQDQQTTTNTVIHVILEIWSYFFIFYCIISFASSLFLVPPTTLRGLIFGSVSLATVVRAGSTLPSNAARWADARGRARGCGGGWVWSGVGQKVASMDGRCWSWWFCCWGDVEGLNMHLLRGVFAVCLGLWKAILSRGGWLGEDLDGSAGWPAGGWKWAINFFSSLFGLFLLKSGWGWSCKEGCGSS